MAIETYQFFFFIWLKYMATTNFNRAIDLQIRIARMAALESIQSHTLLDPYQT